MRKFLLFIFFLSLFVVINAQILVTPAQINSINTAQSAAEGDIYKDTQNNVFYIGTSSGVLKIIGDVAKVDASLSGDGSVANPLKIAPMGATPGQVLSWNGMSWVPANAATPTTTVSNTVTSPNSLTTTVNGVTGSSVNLVTGVTNNSSNNSISTTVNGITSTNVNIINSIQLDLAGNQLVSRVNGIGSTAITLPTADGSETKINSGTNTTVSGSGTSASPYTITVPDATTSLKGVIQLVGDLTGTAINPQIAANAVTTAKIANSTILNEDIADNTIATGKILDGTILTQDIANSQITFAKIQNVTAQRLLGNPTGSTAAPSEIVLGTGLSFSGNVLNVTSSSTNKKMVLSAEYAGAVIIPGSSSSPDIHKGDMNGGNTGASIPYYMNYYEWKGRSTAGAQTYQVVVRITLPNDFTAWQSTNPFQINFMVNNATCNVSYVIKNVANNNTIYTSPSLNATSWTTNSLTTANISTWTSSVPTVAVIITLSSTNGNVTRIGDIILNYQ